MHKDHRSTETGTLHVHSGNLRVAVQRQGRQRSRHRPVVLVHGMLATSRYLRPTIDDLASTHLVVAPDLPGAGATPNPGPPLSIQDNAAVLHDVMSALTGPATLIGHSTGSLVATELAIRWPGLAERLVLVSPPIAPEHRSPRAAALNWARAMAHEPAGLLARSIGDVVTTNFAQSRADLRNTLAYRLEDTIHHVQCPVLVVRGDHDPLVPAPWARTIADRAVDSDYREVPGWHAVPYTAPAALTEAVLAGERPAPENEVPKRSTR